MKTGTAEIIVGAGRFEWQGQPRRSFCRTRLNAPRASTRMVDRSRVQVWRPIARWRRPRLRSRSLSFNSGTC